ncbi:MAG TPA: M28 family peptidase [Mucilaginibacter sp.]|nr:M28 family peptidase [Mucilaginibacter sp.]
MKQNYLLIAALAIGTYASAQKTADPSKYARLITAQGAKKHLSILASDAFEGRETGKPGADKAAHYLEAQFKKMGLKPPVNGSYFLNIPLVENSTKITFSANNQELVNGQDFFAGRGNIAGRDINTGNIVFVGYGTDAETGATDLNDKVLLWINEDKPEEGKTANTGYRMSNARMAILKSLQEKKPALILAVNPDVANLLKRMRGSIMSARLSIKQDAAKPVAAQAPVLNIAPATADMIIKPAGKTYDELRKGEVQTLKADIKASIHTDQKDVKAVDVLGFLPGTDLKDEVLIFSAHYDHIGLNPNGPDKVNNGADDDGSGTTGILEIARAFMQAKKDGHGPRRSILFLGNVGEEKGLLGSEYYTDHPVFPLANTITDLNIDMIGRVGFDYIGKPDSANYVYVIGSAMLSKELHQVNEDANNKYTHIDLDYKYDDPNDPNRFYYRSDHYNFAKHGVPIIFYFNGVHADYHQPGDEVSKINFPLLAKRARLVFYTGWELANMDNRPTVDGQASGK